MKYPNKPADAWKVMEVASIGTLSKLYKSLKDHLPEKAAIANEMGLSSPPVFSGCWNPPFVSATSLCIIRDYGATV